MGVCRNYTLIVVILELWAEFTVRLYSYEEVQGASIMLEGACLNCNYSDYRYTK
jgi:hypothetical protein